LTRKTIIVIKAATLCSISAYIAKFLLLCDFPVTSSNILCVIVVIDHHILAGKLDILFDNGTC